MGIKLFAFGRRRGGRDARGVPPWWEDVHARQVADEPTLRRHVRRYELNHRLPEDYARDRYRPEGTGRRLGRRRRAVVRLAGRPRGTPRPSPPSRPMPTTAAEFRDDAQLVVVTHDPDVIVAKPERVDAGAKMVCILRRNPALDAATFHDHWLHHHGGLFQRIPELNEPLLAYEQNHGLDSPDAAFDGVTEQWFTSLRHLRRLARRGGGRPRGQPGRRLLPRPGQHRVRDGRAAHGRHRRPGALTWRSLTIASGSRDPVRRRPRRRRGPRVRGREQHRRRRVADPVPRPVGHRDADAERQRHQLGDDVAGLPRRGGGVPHTRSPTSADGCRCSSGPRSSDRSSVAPPCC